MSLGSGISAIALTCALVFAGACVLPSNDEYAGGKPADAGAPTIASEAGGSSSGVITPRPNDSGTEAGGTFRSCAEIHAANPTAIDGTYPSANGDLFCNMTLDGGGWTLIARCAGDDKGDIKFGWKGVAGSLGDDDRAYSLGVLNLDLPFTETVVGKRADGGKTLVSAFKMPLARAALESASSSSTPQARGVRLLGTCPAQGDVGPSMLQYGGWTKFENHFHFRDVTDDYDSSGAYGIFSDFANTNYEDCEKGGKLNGERVMLLVR